MSSKGKKEQSAKANNKKTADKKKKRGLSLESLFNNNNFMLALSFLTAFLIWVVMSMNTGETMNYPVSEIPLSMELSEDAKADNLSVVTVDGMPLSDFEATVRVKGNSVTVGSLKASDIQVYGSNLGNIVASGTYTVTLMARQLGVKSNYDIVSVTPSEVKIVVDRNTTSEFTIESQIQATAPVEYYIGTPTLSQQSVTVTGPEQSVSKAVKAVVTASADKELQETTTFKDLEVKLLDADGNEVEDDLITMTPAAVDATIPVLVKKTVPVTVDYVNAPENFDGSSLIRLEPSEIEIAASADTIDTFSSVSAGQIDFNAVSAGMNSMSLSLVMPNGVRNLSGADSVSAKFDFSGFGMRFLELSQYKYRNTPEGLTAEVSSGGTITVRVIGPKTEIAKLTIDNLTASIDLTDAKIGSAIVPVDVTVDGTDCWIYGSYTASITVKSDEDISSSSAAGSNTSQ